MVQVVGNIMNATWVRNFVCLNVVNKKTKSKSESFTLVMLPGPLGTWK